MAKETYDRAKPHLGSRTPTSTDVTTSTFVNDGGVLDEASFSFTGGDQSGFVFVVFASAPVGQGRMSISKSRMKRIHTVENSGLVGTLTFTTQYNARFGVPPVDSKVFVRLIVIDTATGAMTELWNEGVIVVAA